MICLGGCVVGKQTARVSFAIFCGVAAVASFIGLLSNNDYEFFYIAYFFVFVACCALALKSDTGDSVPSNANNSGNAENVGIIVFVNH